MNLVLNGETYLVPEYVRTLLGLFECLNIEPEGKIVEIDGTIYERELFQKVVLEKGQRVEIIQFMGGG